MRDDRVYMSRSIELAGRALGRTFPNPLVGAVIVTGGEIVAEGYHSLAGNPHAEIEALNMAGEKARNGTLYLNLEPCCHYGRTPPCTDAIIGAGISKVVFSIYDPDEKVMGRGEKILRENGIETSSGLMAAEALELNIAYIHRKLTGRPFVSLKLALTLDGRLTSESGRWLTSTRSREYVHTLRAGMEAIAVGRGTVEADDPRLDRRLYDQSMEPPVRMVFDSSLSFPASHRWVGAGERVLVFCSETASTEKGRSLEKAGVEVIRLPEDSSGIDLDAWLVAVGRLGFTSVLVEGGSRIAGSLVSRGLFDRLILFHAPLFGGERSLGWFGGRQIPQWFERGELVLTRSEVIEDDILAVYDRKEVFRYLEKVTDMKGRN